MAEPREGCARPKSAGCSRASCKAWFLQVAVGLGLGHAGGLAVDRIGPEPLVVARPDPAGRSVKDVAVIDRIVGQGQRVAAMSRRPDRLAEAARSCGSSRAKGRPRQKGPAGLPARRRARLEPGLAIAAAAIESSVPGSTLGRHSAARPNAGAAQQRRPARPAGIARQTRGPAGMPWASRSSPTGSARRERDRTRR